MKHSTNYDKVRQFHRVFGHALDKKLTKGFWTDSEHEMADLRVRLLKEELDEVIGALYRGDVKHFAKEIADLLYVTYGLAATYGIPADEVFNRVHESNMSKLGRNGKPVFRNDGKVLKGPDYKEPTMEGLGL